MQYILSQEEYDNLKKYKKSLEDANKKELQELCTRIADEMPIKFWGREEAQPWRCVLTMAKERQEHYCDECPVSKICPNPFKDWSQ